MQPELVLPAELGQCGNGINRSTHRCTRCCHHGDAGTVVLLKPLELFLQGWKQHASPGIDGNATNAVRPQAHDSAGLLQRDMGLFTDQNHRIRVMVEPPAVSGGHQGGEIAERASAGGDAARPLGQFETGGEPAAELTFQLAEAGRQLLSQKIVVETGTDQFRNDRCRVGRRVQMGEGSGVVGLVSTIHQLLEVVQQTIRPDPLGLGECLRQEPQCGKR